MHIYIIDGAHQFKATYIEVTATGALIGMVDKSYTMEATTFSTSSAHSYTEMLWALAPGSWSTAEKVDG
jgi:hypothetical protein